MKRVFAILLAVAIVATSLPLALMTFAATPPDFSGIFANYEDVASKTYFDNNTAINTAGFVADYSNVGVYAAGLGTREANYLKPLSVPGGSVTIEINHLNAIETGLVVHKGQTANTRLTFYTSADLQDWEEVSENKIAIDEANCTTVAASPNSNDYILRRQRIAGFPEGTRYLKVEITTAAAWQPGLDYIDVFNIDRFNNALRGYNETPSKTYFDTNLALNTEGYVAGYNNVSLAAAGLGYREGNYVKPNSTSAAFVAIEIGDKDLVETGLVINNGRLGDTSLSFFTSSDMLNWTPVSDDNIVSELVERDANYKVLKQRVFGFIEGARYLKIQINTTVTWQPGLDYIDVYEPDRFDAAFDGFEELPSKIYFDNNTNLDAEGYVVDYSNVTRKAAGLGTRDGNHVNANSNAGGYVIIEINDKNAVETGLVVHKTKLITAYLKFYTSPDLQDWTEVSADNITTKQNDCVTVNNPPNTTDYQLRRQRVTGFLTGTRYLKVEIITADAWQPGLDYIDVYNPETSEESSSSESSSEESSSAESSSEESSSTESSSEESSSAESSSEESSSTESSSEESSSTESSSEESSSTESSSEESSSAESSSEETSSNVQDISGFNALTNGYNLYKSLISAAESLDSRFILGYKNWRFAKAGFDYRDEYSTQRLQNENGDAELILSVNKDMIVEVATFISNSWADRTSNTYYASSDGTNWVKLSSVYAITRTQSDELPDGYTAIKDGYFVKVERVTNLPEGTTQLKVVTSTNNAANSWWQPGIEYIDLYQKEGTGEEAEREEAKKQFYALTDGFEVTNTLITPKETLDSKWFISYKNWRFAKAGFDFRDEYSTQRPNGVNADAELVIAVTDDMILELSTIISDGKRGITNNTYYVSADGENWTQLNAVHTLEIEYGETLPDGYVGLKSGFFARVERLTELPKGTVMVKVVTSTNNEVNSWWQPGVEYIDIYEKKGKAEEKIKLFNGLTDGYELKNSLISATETLDSKLVLSYKNWRFAKANLNYRDEYSTQRPSGVNADAEIILKVTDDTIVEVASVIAEERLAKSNNTYYASADGKKWVKLNNNSVYVREFNYTDEKPLGYLGLKVGYVARVERVVALPEGTTQLKIVTSTNNESSSWWQPGIEYIDIYEPEIESKLADYTLETELITKSANLSHSLILGSKNLKFTENGLSFKDGVALQREDKAKAAEIIVSVGDNMPLEFGYTVFAEDYNKLRVQYFSTKNGKDWTEISADKISGRKIRSVIASGLDSECCVRVDLVSGLSGVTAVKAVYSLVGGNNAKDAEINYIKRYKEYINPFDTVLSGYKVIETLLTPTNTIEGQTILSYKGWDKFGLVGMPFYDEVGTQRLKDNNADAEIIVSVDEDMAVEVATVIAKSLEGVTANKYFVSADGVNWTPVSAENIYEKRFLAADDNLLTDTSVGLVERIVGLPEDTTMLKIVTSTENKVNSWWQPSINRITLYKDPFDSAVDDKIIVDKALSEKDKLSSDRIVSYKNYKYADGFIFNNRGGALLGQGKTGEMVLNVVDTMTVEIATVSKTALYPHKFYVSADSKNWVELSPECIFERTLSAGDNIATVTRISNMPEGVRFIKLVSTASADFSINYIDFYDKEADKFDLAFVGMGCTDTLFNATRKLNDNRVISYENWHYGTNGFSFVDEFSLQRDSENNSDANFVISVRDGEAIEVGYIISNSWLKKTVTEYYVSADGTNFTLLSSDKVLKRYLSNTDDVRVKEGYSVLKERVTALPEGTTYLKIVVSTANEKNSWWQPGVDYVDIYSAYENMNLEQIAAQTGSKDTTIEITSYEDGLGNSVVFSAKNLESGKFGLSYSDEYSARRQGYDDSEIVLEVNEDTIIEIATIIDNSLEFAAENKFFTSTDGELWTAFDSAMLLTAKITEGVSDGSFVLVQLLSELPADTKYVKIVGTTNGVTDSYRRFAYDYITVYKGESTFKIRNMMATDATIMLVGNFMNIQLQKGFKLTVDGLTDRVDAGKSLIYYYAPDGSEIYDGTCEVVSGMKLVLKKNNKAKREFIISVTYLEGDDDVAIDTPSNEGINIWIIIAAAVGAVVILGGVLLLLIKKRKKKNQ